MCRKMIFLSFILMLGLALASTADAELIGWWKLDEGSGTEFWDETDYWHDGTIDPVNENQVRWTTEGYDANALEFVTATEPFSFCDAPITQGLLDMQDATASFWMNIPQAYQAWGIIFDLLSTSNENSVELDSNAALYITIYGLNLWFSSSTGGLNDNNWHHVTITFSQAENRLAVYVDSRLDATQAYNFSQPITTVRIGGPRQYNAVWRRMVGRLDEVAVYNNALAAADVQNLFWYGPQWAFFATNPGPADKATVSMSQVALTWTAGQTAVQHHVYISENFDDVKNGTTEADKGLIQDASFSDYTWELGKTYYWRIDEVEADGATTHPGVVWSFTVSAKIASLPVPANSSILVDPNVTLSWTEGSGAVSHNVYFGTDPNNLPLASEAQTTTTYVPNILNYNTTYYWRIEEFDGTSKYLGDIWSFKTTPDIQITDPNLLGWYTFNDDVGATVIDWSGNGNHGTISGNPNLVAGYDGLAMQFDGVDDVVEVPRMIQNDLTAMAWINTSTIGSQGTTGREGSGLIWSDYSGGGDHFLVSILGTKLAFETGPVPVVSAISSKDVVTGRWIHVAATRTQSSGQIEIFIDGVSDATATSTTRDLAGSLKIALGGNLIDSRFYTGAMDEVRFYNRVLTQEEITEAMITNPALARKPRPANGSTPDIEHISTLSWVPGENAVQHDVYFGTDAEAVEDANASDTTGIYRGRQDPNTYTPPVTFEIGQTYYWRIDEIDGNASISKGSVWSFTIANYLVVDDFENYDDVTNRIYDVWSDYFINNTGMTVGHLDPPFAETLIVHGGRQSMYMRYDNDGTVNEGTDYEKSGMLLYSEAKRVLESPQDWTRRGVDSLSLWFRGIPASVGSFTIGPPITMTGAGADIWENSDQFHFAYRRLSGLGSITAKVLSMTNTHNSAKAGVMIRESLDPDAAHAMVAIQPVNEVQLLYRSAKGNTSEAIGQTDVSTPVWVKLSRSGNTLTGEYSVDGADWQTLGQTVVPMLADAYIGLIVCSHDNNATCTAEFSDVTTTGTVTGDWQSQDIGIESNSTEQLYIMVQDNAGKSAVVKHPDPAATTFSVWTEWNISLTGFTGVNMQAVKSLTIGVGDRANPQVGGAGILYIDDIWLMIP
jgi:regulation of enolase protein 1 (concanavalin A-like superfamily)